MRRARLLAVDLDRTLLPNGASDEDPAARPLLAAVVADLGLTLAYVTGRRLALVEAALAEFSLPRPDHVVADVGTSLYTADGVDWIPSRAWADRLAEAWGGREAGELARLFAQDAELRLQEPEAQGVFKLSFFTPLTTDVEVLSKRIHATLARHDLSASVVHSVDAAAGIGLVDVLPARGAKLHALEFLLAQQGLAAGDAVFCGDSGNDLEILISDLPAVLVANADDELRERALEEARRAGLAHRLYSARGGLLGMNGNFAAGILEGWVHFHPEDEHRVIELAGALPGQAGRSGGEA